MAKILFKNENLTNLSQETRSILEYMKTIPSNIKFHQDENENASTEEYRPPRSEERMIAKINRYVLDGIDKNKMTHKVKKDINSLIGYMNTFRLVIKLIYMTMKETENYLKVVLCDILMTKMT